MKLLFSALGGCGGQLHDSAARKIIDIHWVGGPKNLFRCYVEERNRWSCRKPKPRHPVSQSPHCDMVWSVCSHRGFVEYF